MPLPLPAQHCLHRTAQVNAAPQPLLLVKRRVGRDHKGVDLLPGFALAAQLDWEGHSLGSRPSRGVCAGQMAAEQARQSVPQARACPVQVLDDTEAAQARQSMRPQRRRRHVLLQVGEQLGFTGGDQRHDLRAQLALGVARNDLVILGRKTQAVGFEAVGEPGYVRLTPLSPSSRPTS